MATTKKRTQTSGRKRTDSRPAGTKRKRSKKAEPSTIAEDVIIIVAFALCVMMFLANFGLIGPAGGFLNIFTFGFFGALGYISPIICLIFICFGVFNKGNLYAMLKLLAAFLLFLLVCSIAWLIKSDLINTENFGSFYEQSMKDHVGGGFFGALLIAVLYPAFGNIGTWLILVVLLAILLLAITDFSVFSYLGFMKEKFADDRDTNLAIKRERQEALRAQREEALERNRKKNAEKMLKARLKISSAQTESNEKTSPTEKRYSEREMVNNPEFRIERNRKKEKEPAQPEKTVANPLSAVLAKRKERENKAAEQDVVIKKTSAADTSDITKEPVSTASTKADPLAALSQIISKEVGKNAKKQEEAPSQDFTEVVEAVRPASITHSEPAVIIKTSENEGQDKPAYTASGMPVRKEFEYEHTESEKIVETASGKIIKGELGNSAQKPVEAPQKEKPAPEPVKAVPAKEYIFPPTSLLKSYDNGPEEGLDDVLKDTATKLVSTLSNYGVGVSISDIVAGPSVTRYELTPEMGVKISKVVGLQNEIMMNLAAESIRIEAPIPGKSAIGIEVPNRSRKMVGIRELLESTEFRKEKSKVAFAAGRDITGRIVIGDIAKMPHLLISGTTGSGKSVCIDSIIVSILYHAKPSEVKMILIDPKKVGFKVYDKLPHLLRPIVTDPKEAVGALSWAVGEMTRRYQSFANSDVRDIKEYNEFIKEKFKGREIPAKALMPQIVIIVEEMADLMLNASGEVEDCIQSLAQMARAAGIHLVLVTQRPSVNVVTGIIKANIPARIALSVSSAIDSRTMIDMTGAEKLLGNGDMLFLNTGMQKPVRVQGGFISPGELKSVISFITDQGEVKGGGFDNEVSLATVAAMTDGKAAAGEEKDETDPLFAEAGALICSVQKASIGMLQRKFRIGFNRAARIMDQLAEAGVVGEEEGTKPRSVMMTAEEFESFSATMSS